MKALRVDAEGQLPTFKRRCGGAQPDGWESDGPAAVGSDTRLSPEDEVCSHVPRTLAAKVSCPSGGQRDSAGFQLAIGSVILM